MPQLTEAELTLQRKYAELRRKKEERKAKAAQEAADKQPAAASGSAAPAADPQTAFAKAKALLAKQSGAGAAAGKAAEKPGPSKPAAPVDLMAAAKAKLQQQAQKKAAAAQKRPTIKRPTVQRPKPEEAASGSGRGGAEGGSGDQRAAKRARTESGASELPDAEQPDPTLFVGDLPPYYTREDVWQLFEHFGPLADVKVMGQACYGFVTFRQPRDAQQVLLGCQRKPIVASGHQLRVNTAYGELPDWKRGITPQQQQQQQHGGQQPPGPGGRAPGRGQRHAGGMHPKVAHAREYGEDLARQLLSAGTHGLDFNAKPQQRELVSYDDL